MAEKKVKTVAVFGGSFNPPHEGHFDTGRHLQRALGVDEIWLMFSENRFKDPHIYAPLQHRMEMGRILARHFPDVPFVMSDVESRAGTHETYHVLKKLQEEHPDIRFIWVMGADNMIDFHKWADADKFMKEFPIAIMERRPYTEEAKQSPMARAHENNHMTQEELKTAKAGWCFIPNPGVQMSSHHLLEQLRAGQRRFDGPFQEVANYIVRHKLYGLTHNAPKPKL